MSNTPPPPEVFATEAAQAFVEEGHGGAPVHSEPELFGLAPFQWVSIAMLLLLLIAFLGAKVHRIIGRGLDDRIAAIRGQLDEAKALRHEAETLRDEYTRRIAAAEKDAETTLANARTEADKIRAQAEKDSAAMIERRKRMAEDTIAAAEREAVQDVRNRAAMAATAASRKLIAEKHDAEADKVLADQMIASL